MISKSNAIKFIIALIGTTIIYFLFHLSHVIKTLEKVSSPMLVNKVEIKEHKSRGLYRLSRSTTYKTYTLHTNIGTFILPENYYAEFKENLEGKTLEANLYKITIKYNVKELCLSSLKLNNQTVMLDEPRNIFGSTSQLLIKPEVGLNLNNMRYLICDLKEKND